MKNLKIGLLGFGAMGKTHTYAVKNLPFYFDALPFTATVAGVATRHAESAKRAAAAFDIPLATEGEDDLIYNKDIDIIDICTPNICHFESAKKALLAGKHVYLEKPLTATDAEAASLAALAKETGLTCMTVFNNRHLAAVTRAKQLIDEGRLGRILHFDVQYLHNSCLDKARTVGWKQDADICGEGGVLFDLGSHALDLAVYLCGKLRTVQGRGQIGVDTHRLPDGSAWQTNAPEAFYMTVETLSGAVGMLTVSKLTQGASDDLSFAIYGEKGALRFSLMQPNYLYFYDTEAPAAPIGGTRGFTAIECVGRYAPPAGKFPAPKAPTGWLMGHVMSMYRFLDAVAAGKPASPDFADGAYVQHLMSRLLDSAKDGSVKEVLL
ncbi:MAG: Gfo/Idh/MocA family oxidoreductase [Clostridia bacterium]|nr:Gfo/Idh/MocA family oxidoreductase [Clostridia bacterium]